MVANELIPAINELCIPHELHSATVADIFRLPKLKPKALKIQLVHTPFFRPIPSRLKSLFFRRILGTWLPVTNMIFSWRLLRELVYPSRILGYQYFRLVVPALVTIHWNSM